MLNIFYSKTLEGCLPNIFNTIKNNRDNFKQVLFTPDRMNLQIEEKIFDALNEKCFFDVDVTTLTRFTNKIILENKINNRVLTKPICVAIIKKILNENKNQFKTIKKALNFNGFAATIFDTISMFKSCNVNHTQISYDTKNKNLNLKLEDLKLIYEKYEEFLQNDYTDSFNKLNLLTNLIKLENFKNTHFYFVGFDDFTPQMYAVISELIKHSASVNVACAVNFIDELNNKNIFLNNVYLNLLNLANINGFKFNRIYCKSNYITEFNEISNNLFGFKIKPSNINPSHIQIFKFNNLFDEVNFAIKQMQWLIINSEEKLSYNDFVIVTPNLTDYKQSFETLFKQNEIPYFFDVGQPISSSIILRFYNDLFELINNNFNKRDLFNFLRCYTNIDVETLSEFESVVNKSGFNYVKILKPIPHLNCENLAVVYYYLQEFINLVENLKKSKTFAEYVNVLVAFAESFHFNNYINNLLNCYVENNNVLEYNKLNNVVVKVNKGFNELTEVLSNYETNVADAFNIIKAYFENMNVVMPPIIYNSVLVTDIVKGEIPKKKYAIIVGMEEGKMPTVQKDLGIISDGDINLLSSKFKLTPTVNVINKRNKFKIYETMLKFENIIGCYVSVSASGEKILPSEVINNLISLFPNLKVINGSLIQNSYQNELTNNYFMFNNTSPSFAKFNLIQNLKLMQTDDDVNIKNNTNVLYSGLNKIDKTTESLVNNVNFENNVKNINNKKLFLQNDNISVSEIESYYSCPFKHFVDYGLKLNVEEDGEFSAILYGNILHEYVKAIVPFINKNKTEDVNDYGQKVLNEILDKPIYKHLSLNPNNVNDIKSLKKEIVRINSALIKLNNASSLKPLWLEKSFKDFKIANSEVCIALKGIIDRVDFDEESFSVIDYKTGGSEFNDFTDIASGKKLQLIIYVYVVSKQTGKQPIGTFYMPLKNSYSKSNAEELYKLKGVISNNISNILKIDKNLNQPNQTSCVLNLKTNKDGEVGGKILVSNEEFKSIVDYSLSMVLNAVKQIKDGNIEPKPLKIGDKSTCEYCEYLGLCKFSEKFGNSYNEFKKVKTLNDLIGE